MLESYVNAMGIRAFEEDFYLGQPATLICKQGAIAEAAKEFSLEQLQRHRGQTC